MSCCSAPGFHDPGKVAIAPDGARALLACQREPPLLVTLGTGVVKALPGPGRGSLSLSPELDAELSPIKDPKILTKLEALAPEFGRPPYDEGGWVSYAEHSHSEVSLIAWRGIGDEWHLHAPLFFVRGDQLTELAFRRHDQVAVLSQWPYLLIAEEYSGATPRLYDWRTGAVLFASDQAFAIGFWPTSAASRK
jgi:hypothetical protein